MSIEMSDGHYDDELQDLLDRRLDAESEARIRAHVDQCARCRQEFENLAWVKRVVAAGELAQPPMGLERSIRDSLDGEHRRVLPRRVLLATAASLVFGAVGAVWILSRPRKTLPAIVAHDYERFRSGALTLDVRATRPDDLEAFFRTRAIPFQTRVLDLAMMRYYVQGARIHELAGQPSAFFVYRGDAGELLVCQMYPGRLEDLPIADEVRDHRGFRFQVYRHQHVTVVFWQEHEIVCVLAGDFGEREVVALAFEKAML